MMEPFRYAFSIPTCARTWPTQRVFADLLSTGSILVDCVCLAMGGLQVVHVQGHRPRWRYAVQDRQIRIMKDGM